jgi:hypothetical protein
MMTRRWTVIGLAVSGAALVLIVGDESIPGIRFIAKLLLTAAAVVLPTSAVLTRFRGRDANRRFWYSTVSLGLSLALALTAAEFITRIAFNDVTTTSDNSSYFSRRWYKKHPLSRNSFGFREHAIEIAKAPNTYRIAVIGDSFTFGQGIFDHQRFSNILQQKLSSSASDTVFEVLNFGRPGAESDEHLKILEEYVLELSPDFVLLQWYTNDVEVLKSARAVPLRLIPSDYASSWLHQRSAFYYVLNRQWQLLQGSLGLMETHVGNMTRRFQDPMGEESIAAMKALQLLFDRLQEQSIPVAMVLFPIMIDVAGDPSAYPLGFLMDRVLELCVAENVPCLDLRNSFAGSLSKSNLWANRLDHHPGAAAHAKAAEAIFDRFSPSWKYD